MTFEIRKIISGGQTGVDRAAMDFALESGIEMAFEMGGYIPKGRMAEDGRISDKYPNLVETETDDPNERTGLNVLSSDATLIISRGELSGGSKLTREFAEKYKKPFMHIDLSSALPERLIKEAKEWLEQTDCKILNIAGPRASEDPEIYLKAKGFLEALLTGSSGSSCQNR